MNVLRKPIAILSLFLFLFVGCGGGGSDFVTSSGQQGLTGPTGTVTLSHPGVSARNNTDYEFETDATIPQGIDSLGLTFLDAAGNSVHYAEVEATNPVSVSGVPLRAQTVEIDYLRGGGLALYEDTETITWRGNQGTVNDPDPGPAGDQTTAWKTRVDPDGRAHITVASQGGDPQEFLVKGVAYSPAPIGYNTRQSLDLGDFFWDSPAPQHFIDWEGLWQRDIEQMREMGFNTLRVYNMMPYHLNNIGPNEPAENALPNPSEIPNPDSGLFLYEHKKFLDACWNNGQDPIYVMVGISMPDAIWYKHVYDNKDAVPLIGAEVKFWDAAFPKMVEQVADHPAVLGFTIFNEKAFPQYYSDDGGAPSEFWWSQVKKYTEMAKSLAPDKLVGWATNDDPNLPVLGMDHLASHGQAIDFFGVNGYQTVNWNPSLTNYTLEKLGDLARPVILTEFGMPNTTRTDRTTFQPYLEPALTQVKSLLAQVFGVSTADISIPGGTDVNLTFPTKTSVNSLVNDDPTVLQRSGEIVGSLTKQAFEHPICVGLTYFDWSDEWWKQESYAPFQVPDKSVPDPNAKKTVYAVELRPDVQQGGMPEASFPGGYWDEEGFGLHSISLNPERQASQVFADKEWKVGANTKPDKLKPRTAVVNALMNTYQNAEQTREAALTR